jgi:D-alanyl-D-alanine carboxypeptidase
MPSKYTPLPNETLRQKQSRFVLMFAGLIEYAYSMGYEMTFGEAYRTPEQCAINAANGKGIANSLHKDRLAVDVNLFLGGKWLDKTADHEPLGIWWESIGGTWGGRFSKPDGNHYSISHEGRK